MNAFEIAWGLLKADPDAQMRDRMGTIPDPIMGMLARRGMGTEDVEIPMENLRDLRQRFSEASRFIPEVQHEDHGMGDIAVPTTDQEFFDTGQALASEERVTPAHFKGGEVTPGPEEGFLTPAQQFRTDPSFAANLRRNVGGQQGGTVMQATGAGNQGFKRIDQTQSTGPRARLGRMEGVARGMKLRGRTKENLPPEVTAELTPQQKQQQLMEELAEMGRGFGRNITFTPDPSVAEPEPETGLEIPMEIQNKIRDVPNYGMNEAALELGEDVKDVRRAMKKIPGFRSGPSARKLEYDRQASTPPEYELQTASGKPSAPGASSGYMIPTGEYGKIQQEIGTMGQADVTSPDSMYSQLMSMSNEMSPFTDKIVTNPDTGEKGPEVDPERQAALNAALARLGLSPRDIMVADHNMRAAEARSPTSDLRSMRGGSDQGERNLTAEEMAAISMGGAAPGGQRREGKSAYDRNLYGNTEEFSEEEMAAARARADEKLGRNKTRL
tara:strand:+ start:3182 stop:4675 length:1494 start_codon:yes stop_codon:yes gene_type:complete